MTKINLSQPISFLSSFLLALNSLRFETGGPRATGVEPARGRPTGGRRWARRDCKKGESLLKIQFWRGKRRGSRLTYILVSNSSGVTVARSWRGWWFPTDSTEKQAKWVSTGEPSILVESIQIRNRCNNLGIGGRVT